MGKRKTKEPGSYKEQITVTLRADMIDRLPKRRGEASKLIETLLNGHFNKSGFERDSRGLNGS
ncbi:MAG: hypothetical protein ACXWAT_00815 [Methylobacter sp.]